MNILDFLGFRPILDSLNFGGVHLQTILRKNKAKVFDSVTGESTLVGVCIETMLAEMAEDLMNMLLMLCGVVRINEDVVKVYNDIDI